MNIKKIVLWSVSIILILGVFGITSFLAYDFFNSDVNPNQQAENDDEEQYTESVDYGNDTKSSNVDSDANRWTEEKIRQTLHEMTHQKVEADKKWGAVRMSDENIKTMIEIVKENKDDLDDADIYLSMLDDWKNGDFDKADEQHNQLWDKQGGSVGKARGLLDDEAEQKYIEKNFSGDESDAIENDT